MKKVVLFLPPYAGEPLGPPAGLLSLAGTLREAGYRTAIIDGAVRRDFESAVLSETGDALCLGISLLTGPMIGPAIRLSRSIKRLRPEFPIVFGGWHPSLLPEQTLRERFVDAVVRYQGELTFLELLRRLETGGSLEGVQGCSYKENGRILHNPDRPAARLEHLPAPAYDLVDFEAYESAGGRRKLPYASSVGCPYACNYCTDTVFYNRRFNALGAARVVSEVTKLVADHRITEVSLLDSNFLVDIRRALEIARGFIDSNLEFTWTFQASTDLLCRMTDDDVRVLGRSGVRHIGFGTESASPEILLRMNKRHQTVDDMFEAARKCRGAGIRATFNLILGYPGEEEAHRGETLKVMAEIARGYDNVTFSPNVFTPYPGIPIWEELKKLGVREPQSLEEWRDLSLGANVLPWLRDRTYEKLKRSIAFFLLSNEIVKASRRGRNGGRKRLIHLLKRPLDFRMKHQFFDWPVELWLLQLRNTLAVRRSLLTGQALSRTLTEAC